MITSATELNKHPGKYINQAIKEPVVVKRSGYPVVVMISYERYTQLEDAYWGELAQIADREKSLGKKATMKFLRENNWLMVVLDLKPKAKKFIKLLPLKHKRQIKDKILSLQNNPIPHDVKKLLGYENYSRIDVGEYRIVYRYDEKKDLITIVLVGKRNDGEIYRIAKRVLG